MMTKKALILHASSRIVSSPMGPGWFCRVVLMSVLNYLAFSRFSFGWNISKAQTTSHSARRRIQRQSAVPLMMMMRDVVPRAAVSVVIRASGRETPRYVLVQRGKEPNKGMWSLPGGKIEAGESTIAAAQRELFEETRISPLDWHEGPFHCTDSIHHGTNGEVEYHYVISQCFCTVEEEVPLAPSDDAADAKWVSIDEMRKLEKFTPGLIQVVERSEELYQSGLLHTTPMSNDASS